MKTQIKTSTVARKPTFWDKLTPEQRSAVGKKAALTKKRRAAGRKAALTRKNNEANRSGHWTPLQAKEDDLVAKVRAWFRANVSA